LSHLSIRKLAYGSFSKPGCVRQNCALWNLFFNILFGRIENSPTFRTESLEKLQILEILSGKSEKVKVYPRKTKSGKPRQTTNAGKTGKFGKTRT